MVSLNPESLDKIVRQIVGDSDPDVTRRLRSRMDAVQEERQQKRKNGIFGYDLKDGELAVNEKESKTVKWIYSQFLAYCQEPPAELVKIAQERAKASPYVPLPYDTKESGYHVSASLVKEYLARELSLKELYYQVVCEKDPSIPFENVLALRMDDLPKDILEKLMADISRLDLGKKQRDIHRILSNSLYDSASPEFSVRTYLRASKGRYNAGKHHQATELELKIEKQDGILSPELFKAAQELQARPKKPKTELER